MVMLGLLELTVENILHIVFVFRSRIVQNPRFQLFCYLLIRVFINYDTASGKMKSIVIILIYATPFFWYIDLVDDNSLFPNHLSYNLRCTQDLLQKHGKPSHVRQLTHNYELSGHRGTRLDAGDDVHHVSQLPRVNSHDRLHARVQMTVANDNG